MNIWEGDQKAAAVFLWVSLFFLLSGLLLYLVFSAPADPLPHSYPVLVEMEEKADFVSDMDVHKKG